MSHLTQVTHALRKTRSAWPSLRPSSRRGSDGLTNQERSEFADRFASRIAAPPSAEDFSQARQAARPGGASGRLRSSG